MKHDAEKKPLTASRLLLRLIVVLFFMAASYESIGKSIGAAIVSAFVGVLFLMLFMWLGKVLQRPKREEENSQLMPLASAEESLVLYPSIESMPIELSAKLLEIPGVYDCLKAGNKMEAIKCVRNSTDLGLRESKDYVDELERLLKDYVANPKQEEKERDISSIDGMEGHLFEHFCAELLRKVGYTQVKVTPESGDHGVDILAVKDGVKFAIQCKNYSKALNNTPVQEVYAGKQFYNCHVGVVMTNSTFTQGAYQLAKATNVLLWDRSKLESLISQAGGLQSINI